MTEIQTYPNLRQSFGITGIVILAMILLIPISILLNKIISKDASLLVYYLLSMGLPFLMVYNKRKLKTGDTSFNITISNPLLIPIVIVGTLALLFGAISPIGSLIPMSEAMKKIFIDLGSSTGVFSLLLMVIAAPVFEELIFRGIILDGLLRKYSPLKSILVSSILFGIVHLNPWQFVTATLMGCFIGWIYYKTKCLSLSIIMHASSNLFVFIARFFVDSDTAMNTPLIESYGGVLNFIMITIGSLLVFCLCIYFLYKHFFSKNPTLSELKNTEQSTSGYQPEG